ncbi:MAG: hypothetical protein AB1894_19810 [Chloroflexota bacterium]
MRGLPAYLERTPRWCERIRQQARHAQAADLLAMWTEMDEYVREIFWRVVSTA